MNHKTDKVLEIVAECLDNNIPVSHVKKVQDANQNTFIGFEVSGFSKSGTATIWQNTQDEVVCETRYNTVDIIETFEDLAQIAFRWNLDYIDHGYSWDDSWAPVFVKYNWLKTKTVTVYEYVNN